MFSAGTYTINASNHIVVKGLVLNMWAWAGVGGGVRKDKRRINSINCRDCPAKFFNWQEFFELNFLQMAIIG